MNNQTEICELIIKLEIPGKMESSFNKILLINTAIELDLENKNVSINSNNIEYSKTEFNYHRFQTPILNQENNRIGYFALIITNENERIDEYFVID